MAKHDIIVIGASAGGVYALKELAASLPPDFKAAIFIVQHLSSTAPSFLPKILSSVGPLKAEHPADGDPIRFGHIYIAPPDHHLLIESDRILVKRGPKENRFRPSIDALFRSAAYSCGTRVIGVVLTGLLDDGTSGMWSIKRLGGIGIIQDPDDAMYPSMPNSVLEYVEVDHRVSIAGLAPLLCQLTEKTPAEIQLLPAEEAKRIRTEVEIAAQKNAFDMGIQKIGEPSSLTCPECHGALVQLNEGKLVRYRCHTGHAFTASFLLSEVSKSVEDSLWNAVRALEEAITLLEQKRISLEDSGHKEEVKQVVREIHHTRQQARRLHEFIFNDSLITEPKTFSEDLQL